MFGVTYPKTIFVAGTSISDFGGDHPAIIARGYTNMQECQLYRNTPSRTTPVIFGDVLPAAVALQVVEWPDFAESSETVRLGGQPNLDAPVFFSDDTSLEVALTAGSADPDWVVRALLCFASFCIVSFRFVSGVFCPFSLAPSVRWLCISMLWACEFMQNGPLFKCRLKCRFPQKTPFPCRLCKASLPKLRRCCSPQKTRGSKLSPGCASSSSLKILLGTFVRVIHRKKLEIKKELCLAVLLRCRHKNRKRGSAHWNSTSVFRVWSRIQEKVAMGVFPQQLS